MLKLLGAALLLAAGTLAALQSTAAYRRELETLAALQGALLRMEEEIRLRLTPMPQLLSRLARESPPPVGTFFDAVRRTMGQDFPTAWHSALPLLKIPVCPAFATLALRLTGDEQAVCKSLCAAAEELARVCEEKSRRRGDREKIMTSLCLSAALFLIILLI